jgi:hypothetical protein
MNATDSVRRLLIDRVRCPTTSPAITHWLSATAMAVHSLNGGGSIAECGKKRNPHNSKMPKLAFIKEPSCAALTAIKIARLINGTPHVKNRTMMRPRSRGDLPLNLCSLDW